MGKSTTVSLTVIEFVKYSDCGLFHWGQYRGEIRVLRHLWWSIRPWGGTGNSRLGILSKALRKVSLLPTTLLGVSGGYRVLVRTLGYTPMCWYSFYSTYHTTIALDPNWTHFSFKESTSIVTVVRNQIQVVAKDLAEACILDTNLPADYKGHSLNAYNNVLYLCGGHRYYGKECRKFDLTNPDQGTLRT